MAKQNDIISMRSAALIAGFMTLAMVFCAPFAELFAYPKLVIDGSAADTIRNLTAYKPLFALLIMAYAFTFMGDVVTAWALYILLKPVNAYLSLLAALFRLTFALIALVSLLNLTTVFRMLGTGELQGQVLFLLNAFRYNFHFGLMFFGIYLSLLGYLVWRSGYIPWILGLLLIISGLGYFASSLQPYLYPQVNMSFAVYTFYGELVFMLWLVIRGWRIKEIV